jgi:hypothetical protein
MLIIVLIIFYFVFYCVVEKFDGSCPRILSISRPFCLNRRVVVYKNAYDLLCDELVAPYNCNTVQ